MPRATRRTTWRRCCWCRRRRATRSACRRSRWAAPRASRPQRERSARRGCRRDGDVRRQLAVDQTRVATGHVDPVWRVDLVQLGEHAMHALVPLLAAVLLERRRGEVLGVRLLLAKAGATERELRRARTMEKQRGREVLVERQYELDPGVLDRDRELGEAGDPCGPEALALERGRELVLVPAIRTRTDPIEIAEPLDEVPQHAERGIAVVPDRGALFGGDCAIGPDDRRGEPGRRERHDERARARREHGAVHVRHHSLITTPIFNVVS